MLGFDHIIVQTILALPQTRKMSTYCYACLLHNNNNYIIIDYLFKNVV